MAKCYITCDIGADPSHVETIKTWLTEKKHELVDSDISNNKDGVYIQIGRGSVDILMPNGRAHFLAETRKFRRPENQEQPKSMIESVLECLEKNHVEWS